MFGFEVTDHDSFVSSLQKSKMEERVESIIYIVCIFLHGVI